MNALISMAASNQAPLSFEANKQYFPNGLLASAGLDRSTALKASLWRSTIVGAQSSLDLEYLSLVHHRKGGMVWDETTPDAISVPGTVSVHSLCENQIWVSEGDVEFAHFYLPIKLLEGVTQTLFEAEFSPEHVRPTLGDKDITMVRLMGVAGDHLFQSPSPDKIVLDSWSILLAETFLRRLSEYAGVSPFDAYGELPPKGIARVIDYIEAHIGEDLGLSELAGVAAMSVYQFSRAFKATMNETPHAYVLRRRVERAQDLLLTNDLSLVEVAYACGFSNQSHFTNVFGAHMGITPGRFRREFAN